MSDLVKLLGSFVVGWAALVFPAYYVFGLRGPDVASVLALVGVTLGGGLRLAFLYCVFGHAWWIESRSGLTVFRRCRRCGRARRGSLL